MKKKIAIAAFLLLAGVCGGVCYAFPKEVNQAKNSVADYVTDTRRGVITETQAIPHGEQDENDANMNVGQTWTAVWGTDGKKEIKYAVTYRHNREVSRTKLSEQVVIQPVDDMVHVGTREPVTTRYVPISLPSYSTPYTPLSDYFGSNDYYINSFGNTVPSPSYNVVPGYTPTGTCQDGTFTYSEHAQGSCSGHGGLVP